MQHRCDIFKSGYHFRKSVRLLTLHLTDECRGCSSGIEGRDTLWPEMLWTFGQKLTFLLKINAALLYYCSWLKHLKATLLKCVQCVNCSNEEFCWENLASWHVPIRKSSGAIRKKTSKLTPSLSNWFFDILCTKDSQDSHQKIDTSRNFYNLTLTSLRIFPPISKFSSAELGTCKSLPLSSSKS